MACFSTLLVWQLINGCGVFSLDLAVCSGDRYTAFYSALKNATSSGMLHQLNFNHYTSDEVNHAVSNTHKKLNLVYFIIMSEV